MKKISPIWFLKKPIELEHKSYILLDQLKGYNEEIKNNNIYSTLNDLFEMISDIKKFSKTGNLPKTSVDKLIKSDLAILKAHRKNRTSVEFNNLDEVIELMISILYRYAEISINALKEYGPIVKKFEIIPEGEFTKGQDIAILFIRSTIDDHVMPFIWDNKFPDSLIDIEIEKAYYSMSYVYLAHEIIDRNKFISKRITPRIFVCEINEHLENNKGIVDYIKKSLVVYIKSEIL